MTFGTPCNKTRTTPSPRCSENIQPLSAAHLDVSISYAAVVASQTLTKTCAAGNNANSVLGNVKSNQAVANWLQAIFLEVIVETLVTCLLGVK